MIPSHRRSSPRTARWAALFSLVLPACGAAAPEPAPAPAPAAQPAGDADLAVRVAEAALNSLSRRKFVVTACTASEVRVISEADAAAPPPASERCAVLAAHRADKTWLVVVRAPAQPGNVWAVVTVSPKGEGVVHIDYKP